ncbi:hypothetical protein Acr_13g0003110 [Actinidia rufa]|uniref:Reverse transcriptase zinc-binding domain-containing protein n=1 Tax=Actinidia rufa TaxID=165716 RepID=A0A7J0FJP8_9ERIC|nr:hypothetical protein Acr_13g0003110 [Actinidia rufa]
MRNKISSLLDDKGNRLEELAAIKKEILGYFIKLLSAKVSEKRDAKATLAESIESKIPEGLKDGLVWPVTVDEIKNAIFSNKGDKAPGPDGYNAVGVDFEEFHLINEAFQKFYLFSGLKPNWNKSAIYYAGVGAYVKEIFSQVLAISEGYLPVKYLECQQAFVISWEWTVVQSILFSIQVYWSSVFILPQKIMEEIESDTRAFLWFGYGLKHPGAKVKWEHGVCKKADTLWVKWIRTYVIKKLGAGWELSWTLKKIFKLQEIGQALIKYEVGDGDSTFLWLENWHPFGSSYRSHGVASKDC